MFRGHHDRMRRGLAVAAFTGAGLLILFWALYASGVIAPADPDDPIARFERAFPIADALLAVTLAVAGTGLLRRRGYGLFCMVGASGMTLYLGLLDLTFYASQGHYSPPAGEAWVELVVNVLCLGGGALALWACWRIWSRSWRRDVKTTRSWSSARRAA